jgi:hypothetical protein
MRGCSRPTRMRSFTSKQRRTARATVLCRVADGPLSVHAVKWPTAVSRRDKPYEAAACCRNPRVACASSGMDCLDFNDGASCPALAIFGSARTNRATFNGTTRHMPVRSWSGSGRRRRCPRTFPGQFMQHRCCATTRPLIDRRRQAHGPTGGRASVGSSRRRSRGSRCGPRTIAKFVGVGLPYRIPEMMS